jgi:hypothetical protein
MQQTGNCYKLVNNNSLKIIRKAPILIGAANVGKYPLTASGGRRYFAVNKPFWLF